MKVFSALSLFVAGDVMAATMPFLGPLEKLKVAITGPFLMSVAAIMIVITCLMLAFGEWGDGFKKIINIVLWLSVAFGAVGFVAFMKP